MNEVIIIFENLYRDYQRNLKNFEALKSFSFNNNEFVQFRINFQSLSCKVENSKKEVNLFLSCLSTDSLKILSMGTKYPVHYLE